MLLWLLLQLLPDEFSCLERGAAPDFVQDTEHFDLAGGHVVVVVVPAAVAAAVAFASVTGDAAMDAVAVGVATAGITAEIREKQLVRREH